MTFNSVKKLGEWLTKRDYCEASRDINRIVETYEDEIEKARIYATAKILLKLDSLRQSCISEIKDPSTTARYKQLATIELKKIKAQMIKLEDSIPYGSSTLSSNWRM
jgi:hypothetical protein